MKERECKHFVDSIIYLMEQTARYCETRSEHFFSKLKLDITKDEYIIIDTISFNEGICQRDLSKLILKNRSYTSRILDSLEEKDLIYRKVEEKGKKLVKRLYLTEEAKEIYKKMHNQLIDLFFDVFKNIPDEEFEQTRRGIEKMKDCISKYTIIPL